MILIHLIKKEFKQMLRNRLLPVVFVLLPLLLMNMIPRIATQEVKGIKFAVVDNDHSTTTSRLIQKIDASTYLSLAANCPTYRDAMQLIASGEIDAIIEFPLGYEKTFVTTGALPELQVSANATNGMKGSMAGMYITQIVGDFAADLSPSTSSLLPSTPSLRYLFNYQLDYKRTMIPVIFAFALILIVGFLPALNIVLEKEKGTIEQINVTPIRKIDFILSKIIPYIVVGMFMTLEALMAARALYGITPQGSPISVMVVALVFAMFVASFGLIISNYSSTLQQAALTMFFFLVIFILTSGLLTPIRSMPDWAQTLTYANPMRYIVEAMRAIFIKGSSLVDLWNHIATLLGFAAIGWTWAIVSYRKNG